MDPEGKRVLEHFAQVAICPLGAGFLVCIGRLTFWIEAAEAEDLLEALGRALMIESADDDMGNAETELDDVKRGSTNSRPIPGLRGSRKN